MKDFVFVSVAFGPLYIAQQDRLKASILRIYPEANILFWRDALPDNSKPFLDSLYGFKVHAIKKAIDLGYKRVLWLDPAMILNAGVAILKGLEFVAVKDENKLSQYISNAYLSKYFLTREQLKATDYRLVGGSLYFFDFNFERTYKIFLAWYIDESKGYFGSQQQEASEQLQGHRADESCMAMSIYLNGSAPVNPDKIGYCIAESPTFSKKHFK